MGTFQWKATAATQPNAVALPRKLGEQQKWGNRCNANYASHTSEAENAAGLQLAVLELKAQIEAEEVELAELARDGEQVSAKLDAAKAERANLEAQLAQQELVEARQQCARDPHRR